MGFYENRILPRLLDATLSGDGIDRLRRRTCAGLRGEVLEIGFGSGRNVPFYPARVDSVTAVEPVDRAWELAAARVAASPVPIRRAGLDGQSLPFEDASFDSALSTWTLCTIPDHRAALAEIRRVLRPGGELRFVEHGLAPDEKVQRWQRRMEPIQKRLAGGCHLTRPIVAVITGAGFTITEVDEFYGSGAPKFGAAFSLGGARSGVSGAGR
jgi:ubiquinone/menaquinone biosynthesis C-methylase UbiE